ncbi:MAG: HRDC domain-containing protein [Opitutaceae bacterium]|nr:HRDC domain-containing protein [Opitutaceae bacterium]
MLRRLAQTLQQAGTHFRLFNPAPATHPAGLTTPAAALNASPVHTFIDQPAQLAPLLDALQRVDEVALDTEADNLFRYRTRICLLQVMAGREIFLVDLLAPLPLDGLWQHLAAKHLVMHGSDFDLRLLYDFCGFTAHSLFDTMMAAQLLNRPRIGLASLLEQHFGVALTKEGQKANWSRRPLTQKLVDYAALDVFYLPALRDILRTELERCGRLGWQEQRCRWQIESARNGFPQNDEHAWRIGRSERLGPRGLCVLWAVWHWREETARQLDQPPFKITGNDLLIEIAARADAGLPEEAVLAVNLGKRHSRLIHGLTEAVRAGRAKNPASLPRRRRERDPNWQPLNATELALQDRLKADRDRLAQQLNLDPTLIANRAQLAQIARDPARIDDILLPWQADLLRNEPALKNGEEQA